MAIQINGNGTITGISVGGLPNGIVDTDMIAANAVTAAKRGAGAVLQVQSVLKQNGFSATASSGSFSDITGLTVDITMTSSSNKVLVLFQSSFSTGGDVNQRGSFRLLRGSTVIGAASADGQSTNQCSFPGMGVTHTGKALPVAGSFLDTPGTGTHTYKLQVGAEGGAGTVIVNAPGSNGTGTSHFKGVSSIILMEVAA